jgi:SAM-dependent methyltransferase
VNDERDRTLRTEQFWGRQLEQSVLLYPSEDVVRFLARAGRVPPGAPQDGLDVGFGSGRHLKLLLDYGYRAHGIDFASNAIEVFRSHFGGHPLLGDLVQGDIASHIWSADCFQAAIVWGTLFSRARPDMQRDLALIRRALKPDGVVCLNLRTRDNWFYGLGQELEQDYFLLDERAGPYGGALYCFVDEPAARELVNGAGLEIVNFERSDAWRGEARLRHSWWIVWARKA